LRFKKNPCKLAKEQEEEWEVDYNQIDPSVLLHMLQQQAQSLENRGILIIDQTITKQSLAYATRKLLEYHFDNEFIDPIQIILNSPGGYTDAGHAFIDLMGFVKNNVNTIALGQISSMATDIFIHGDKRIMAPNCVAMIHQFSSRSEGTYNDLVATRKYEDLEMQRHIDMLVDCSKYKTAKEVKEHLLKGHDNYLSPREMMKHGLCDDIFKSKRPRHTKQKSKCDNK
jgi:ATP-dependent protease ClpP protease subunit